MVIPGQTGPAIPGRNRRRTIRIILLCLVVVVILLIAATGWLRG
jgi:hypothetical protein